MPTLDPYHLGAVLALYEHRAFVQSVIWNINAFDQWGVELGKRIAGRIALAMNEGAISEFDPSTRALIEIVRKMISELCGGVHLEGIKRLNDQLQVVEGEADKVINELLRELYSREQNAVKIVFARDLFELLEKVADRARDAGNVINHIVLKNS